MTRTGLRTLLASTLLLAAPAAFAQDCDCCAGSKTAKVSVTTASHGIAEGALEKGVRTFELAVTGDGFVPAKLRVGKGENVRLVVTRKTDRTCATELVIKEKGINAPLPLEKAVTVEFKADRSGEIRFACAMGHVGGVVFVP